MEKPKDFNGTEVVIDLADGSGYFWAFCIILQEKHMKLKMKKRNPDNG